MAPRRRSSRLNRGATPNHSNAMPSPTKLASLDEREESPPSGFPVHIDAIGSSSNDSYSTAISRCTSQIKSPAVITPPKISGDHASYEEMHPSKAQHGSVKFGAMDSQSRLLDAEGSRTVPEPRVSSAAVVQSTPTKMRGSLPALLSSPNFNFTFSPTDANLSAEAQKIMDSVRQEAAKIKAQLQAERGQQEHQPEDANHLYGVGGRTIAKPRGKAGRYSEVHMQEFKKMDSIAGHASTWKTKTQPNAASLKRSNSKARLKTEEPKAKVDGSSRSNDDDRLENTAPGKRAKKNYRDDASSARPPSRDEASEAEHSQPGPSQTWGLPSAVTTPTTASLARSASVKHVKTSMIPSPSRSQSTKIIRHAVTPKLEGGRKHLTSLSRLGNMKSILHRRQPKYSDDPAKVAAGTHIPAPEVCVTVEKQLPSLPSLPSTPHPERRTPAKAIVKHVDFTPGTKLNFDFTAMSPSPSKIPQPQSHQPTGLFTSGSSLYPSLANSPHIMIRTPKIHTPSAPIEFSFRADKALPLEQSPLAGKTPTIRQVRPSGIATPMTALENLPPNLSPIPHGISNKKRRRVDSDDEDVENFPVAHGTEENDDGPRTKKVKFSPQKAPTDAKMKTPKLGGTAIPKPAGAKPGVLSLSRLHMLSRPKNRR
ncbi:hypothetical protein MMC07_008993 [Pseudocyphellaria aurata]|nr:hypothetical protein [Pseudocyphellaria aurata]